MGFSSNIVRGGELSPPPPQIPLRAGQLSLVYANGDLRYIKLGEVEILCRVYVAIRDHNWDTIQPVLSDVLIDIGEDRFSISYTARNRASDVDFTWQATINGTSDGRVEFRMDGEALSNFQRNRIGFCVLHPMSCAGQRAMIEHANGAFDECHFPVQIAPQLAVDGAIQPVHPFSNMRALAHEVARGIQARVAFSGEIFEMEDQRNWTDASYKTYGTPLERPFPADISAGAKIQQSIVLTLAGNQSIVAEEGVAAPGKEGIKLTVNRQQPRSIPALGLGMASHGQQLTDQEIACLRTLNLSHLRVDLDLSDSGFADVLHAATAQAKTLGVALEAALFLSDAATEELASLRQHIDVIAPPICRWLIFHRAEKSTAAAWVALAREQLASYASAATFGAGSNAYFAEINRTRPNTANIDFLTYSINPQVHAFDNASLIETLAAQAVTVASARHFAAGKEIIVSPVTLRPRFNPNATGPEPDPAAGELPSQVDVRQMALFGAAWTVGSLAYLLTSDASAVTYFETTGWCGVMEQAAGNPAPEAFHSTPGMVFPLFHILADVGEFAGGEILKLETSKPLTADGFALRHKGKLTTLVANLNSEKQRITVDGLGLKAQTRVLDETVFETATKNPASFRGTACEDADVADGAFTFELLPYASVRIDTV